MNKEKLTKLYKKYELTKDDVFKHQHYLIINRGGIDKIQAIADIEIKYEVVICERDFAVVKAVAKTKQVNKVNIETFGSALKGVDFKTGNTNSFYVIEMAEKRAMSRAVLKLTGFYELGVFGEDESEEFKNK